MPVTAEALRQAIQMTHDEALERVRAGKRGRIRCRMSEHPDPTGPDRRHRPTDHADMTCITHVGVLDVATITITARGDINCTGFIYYGEGITNSCWLVIQTLEAMLSLARQNASNFPAEPLKIGPHAAGEFMRYTEEMGWHKADDAPE